MPFRFRKRIKIFPGFYINLGKKGINSASIGPRGFTTNINSKGTQQNVDLPLGFSYQTKRTKLTSSAGGDQPYNYETVNSQLTQTWHCSACETLNPPHTRYCGNCGTISDLLLVNPSGTIPLSPKNNLARQLGLLFAILGGLTVFGLLCSKPGSGTDTQADQPAPRSFVSNSVTTSPTPTPTASPAKATNKGSKQPASTPQATLAAPVPGVRQPRSNGFIRGPRGGCYYINGNGNKTYVDRSLCN